MSGTIDSTDMTAKRLAVGTYHICSSLWGNRLPAEESEQVIRQLTKSFATELRKAREEGAEEERRAHAARQGMNL